MIDFKEYLTRYRDVIDREVAGYFYPIDIVMLNCILTNSQKYIQGNLCEIGVAKGKSAICLSNFKNKTDTLYLYDNFSEDDRLIADSNLHKFGNHDNIVWRVCDTTTLNQNVLKHDDRLRLLHIDGCHEHWAVLSDLNNFSKQMYVDGIIVVDDFNDYEYPGVNSAVHKFCLSNNNVNDWRIFAIGDNKAYLCTWQFLSHYRNSMLDFMAQFNMNPERPFDIKMCLRQVHEVNVLLCDAREVWSVEKIRENFSKKLMGLL